MAMRALVDGYVEAHGRRLSAAVRAAAAAADPADQREPRAPQPLCAQMLQALAAARDEAALLIDDSAAAQPSGGEIASPSDSPEAPDGIRQQWRHLSCAECTIPGRWETLS